MKRERERQKERKKEGEEKRMKGGEEVLEAEFALAPISTFGLQILSPLLSITMLVWWQ